MPQTSVAAPVPQRIDLSTVTESTEVLWRRVTARGLCVRATFRPDEDPWYPASETGDKAAEAARIACRGCPVIGACLELALREESRLGNIHGVRGGMAADERLALIRDRRHGGDQR